MPTVADLLYLKLYFRRLDTLRESAVSARQRRQVGRTVVRVTASLFERGWSYEELAHAAGVSGKVVRDWVKRGLVLDRAGIAVPEPGQDTTIAAQNRSPAMSVPEVAEINEVDVTTIRRWIKNGRLPAHRRSVATRADWVVGEHLVRTGASAQPGLTVGQVATRFRVHPKTVRQWIHDGKLVADQSHPGGRYWVLESALPPVGQP